MKIVPIAILFSCFLFTTLLHGYRKYSFIWYDYGIVKKDAQAPIVCAAKGPNPFTHKTHYGFADTAASKGTKVYRCVKLNLADRRHIRKGLKAFGSDTKITDELIAKFCNHKRMKIEVVSWVLRDFQRGNSQATIGDVRNTLRL